MSTLTIELPDQQTQSLQRIANERGVSVERIISELVAAAIAHDAVDHTYDVTVDPLYSINAYESDAPHDLSQSVDHYLYGEAHQ